MTHARPANRVSPQVAILFAAALAVTLTVSALLTSGLLSFPNIQLPGSRGDVSPAVIRAEQEWERQRHQISGYVDPIIRAEQEWERVRKQLSGAFQ